MTGMPYSLNLCFPNHHPAPTSTQRDALSVSVSLRWNIIRSTHAQTAAASEVSRGREKSLRAPSTACSHWLFLQHLIVFHSYLIVYNHNIVAVRTQPRVHGLTDAADFVQGWSVVVGPAKVQNLREEEKGCCSYRWSYSNKDKERRC